MLCLLLISFADLGPLSASSTNHLSTWLASSSCKASLSSSDCVLLPMVCSRQIVPDTQWPGAYSELPSETLNIMFLDCHPRLTLVDSIVRVIYRRFLGSTPTSAPREKENNPRHNHHYLPGIDPWPSRCREKKAATHNHKIRLRGRGGGQQW